MKINEKNLTMFAISPPLDLDGYLSKRGEVNKSWQRRYFVLKGNLLFYFEKRGDREPLGLIIIEGCTIELSEDGEQYCFQIVFHGINNRTYYLSAETQTQMEQWMKALTCAGYEYMKLIVSELQRQLEDLDGTSKASTPISPTDEAPKPPPRRQNPFNRSAPPPPTSANVIPKSGSTDLSEAVTPPTNGNIRHLNEKDETMANGAETSQPIAAPSNTLTIANSTVVTFEQVHDVFGRQIMRDLNEYRQSSERPLIML